MLLRSKCNANANFSILLVFLLCFSLNFVAFYGLYFFLCFLFVLILYISTFCMCLFLVFFILFLLCWFTAVWCWCDYLWQQMLTDNICHGTVFFCEQHYKHRCILFLSSALALYFPYSFTDHYKQAYGWFVQKTHWPSRCSCTRKDDCLRHCSTIPRASIQLLSILTNKE